MEFFQANLITSPVIQKSDDSIQEAATDFPLPIQKEDVASKYVKSWATKTLWVW